ncbi:MAG: HEAT repeat domain-containing protein [Bacteroidia bacterium]|nr:HEAT repeat domain-containing protein [Bacteroidia bacterium]
MESESQENFQYTLSDDPDKLLDQFLDSTYFYNYLEEDYFMEAYWLLKPREQMIARKRVARELKKLSDPRAPRFYRIAPVKKGLPDLEAALPESAGLFRFETLWSLMMMGARDRYQVKFMECLNDPDAMVRRQAVRRVWLLEDPKFLPFLFDLLNDPDETVVENTLHSIAMIADLPLWFENPESIVAPVFKGVMSPHHFIKVPSILRLKAMVKAKIDGKTNEELGLHRTLENEFTPAFSAFLMLKQKNQQGTYPEPYPKVLFDELAARERDVAEKILLGLVENFDPYAARALVDLENPQAVEAFKGMLKKQMPPDFALEVARGLWLLAGIQAGLPVIQRLQEHPDDKIGDAARDMELELRDLGADFD